MLERDVIMKMPDSTARAEALRKWALPRNGVPLFAQRVYMEFLDETGRVTSRLPDTRRP